MKTAVFAAALCAAVVDASPISKRALSSSLQSILDNTHGSNLYTYPTDLTRNIVPKPLHSHNDYWRDVPYWEAISVGAVSVEADVWLVNGTLFVGHEISALTTDRTFQSLYVQPILNTIKRQNPTTPFVNGATTKNGVFDTSSGQTLYLWIDVKTDGPTTWPYVLKELQPLRDAGFLSTTNGTVVISNPVTAIGTGNTPITYFQPGSAGYATPQNIRDTFFDASLPDLNGTQSNITAAITPIASTQFSKWFGHVVQEGLNATQLALLRSQIAVAHGKGIGVRYWDQPGYPIGTRNAIWRLLIDEGVDLLNVDDLEGAAGFWQNSG